MGLLRRAKEERKITRKSDGKQFVRGWKYTYSITNQGWKYAHYLVSNAGKSREQRHSDRYKHFREVDETTIFGYALRLSVPSDDAALEILAENPEKYQLPEHGVYRRFPRMYDRELLLAYIASLIESKRWMLISAMMQSKMEAKQKKQKQELKELQKRMDNLQENQRLSDGSP